MVSASLSEVLCKCSGNVLIRFNDHKKCYLSNAVILTTKVTLTFEL